jgi:hypothetical protein
MVYEARGDKKQAALYYRKVVEFARQRPDDYDPEIADNFQNLAASTRRPVPDRAFRGAHAS